MNQVKANKNMSEWNL